MSYLLLVFVIAISLWLLLRGLVSGVGIYRFSALAAATFLGFVVPQAIGLVADPFLPADAAEQTLLVALMCLLACAAGEVAPGTRSQRHYWVLDEQRLVVASAVLSLVGAYFYFAISRLPAELTNNGPWTGLPVAYLFFARVLTYGLAIAVLLYAATRSKAALCVAVLDSFFYWDRIVLAARRADLIEFGAIVLFCLWFGRGFVVPRWVVVLACPALALFINSIGDYRSAMSSEQGPQWHEVAEIDFLGNTMALAEDGGQELRNAAYTIAAVSRKLTFDYGASHWNGLVFAYVPAQLVGRGLKDSLMLPIPEHIELIRSEFLFDTTVGSTYTGLADSYQSFWYFGFIKFFLISLVMARLLNAACNGSFAAQICYMLLVTPAMHAVTHTTQWFVNPIVHMVAFLLPALWWARRGRALPELSVRSSAACAS
jgi:hypothetical protein